METCKIKIINLHVYHLFIHSFIQFIRFIRFSRHYLINVNFNMFNMLLRVNLIYSFTFRTMILI